MKKSSILALALALMGQLHAEPYKLTAYCPCVKCCGEFPGKITGQTASGAMAQAGHTIAAPKGVPFGARVLAVVDGQREVVGIVEDRGGAIQDLRLDIYFATHQEALDFGVQYVEITFEEVGI